MAVWKKCTERTGLGHLFIQYLKFSDKELISADSFFYQEKSLCLCCIGFLVSNTLYWFDISRPVAEIYSSILSIYGKQTLTQFVDMQPRIRVITVLMCFRNIINDDSCSLVNLCTIRLVNLCFCVLVYLCTGILV